MRFDEITLERYGAFDRRVLALTPGLNVVHGPNEAGKSTCLHAVRDFLFRIPERSPRSARFGSDAIRVGARLTTAAGDRISLRRRCGRGRTLVDDAGAPQDDAVLSSLLGAVDRDRFATLFGLGHEELRRGGDALLAANGDVGKLIVEAGGGLRALVGRLDGMARDIDELFAPRRKGSRAFYGALSAFEEADKAARAGLLTRDAHERDRRALGEAVAATARLRVDARDVAERASRLGRLERVIPLLRRMDATAEAVAAFDDVAHLPDDFAEGCLALLDASAAAAGNLEEARGRLADVDRRRSGMRVDERLAGAEADVRDVEARLAVVRASRDGRRALLDEAEAADAQLALLRERLGAGRDELATLLPNPPTLDAVRAAADLELSVAARVRAARKEADAAARVLADARDRLTVMASRGHDRPVNLDAGIFSTLPSERAAAEARVAAAADLGRAAHDRAAEAGLVDVAAARRLPCPDVAWVEAWIQSADDLRAERARATAARARAAADRDMARADAEALLAIGEVASEEGLALARRERDDAWAPIRSGYLGGLAPAPADERRGTVRRLDDGIAAADRLADRRGAEAGRVAALAEARRRIAFAEAEMEAADAVLRSLDQDLSECRDRGAKAFPEACALRPEPPALLALVAARAIVIATSDQAAAERRAGEATLRCLEPAMERLTAAERSVGLPPEGDTDLAARVRAVASAIAAHDRGHDEHRREAAALPGHAERCRLAEEELADAEGERARWVEAWAGAVAPLGLPADAPVASTAELARLWEKARGDLRAAAQARRLLGRLDAEEAWLGRMTSSIAGRVGLAVPVDPVAAGEMLVRLWEVDESARLGREALGPEVAGAEAEVARCERTARELDERLAALAAAVGATPDADRLRGVAIRRRALGERRLAWDALAEAVWGAGDGLPASTLRVEAEGCDLDLVRAELADLAGRREAAEAAIDAAIREEERAMAVLRAHEVPSAGAGLIAAREAAVADMHDAVERWVELKVAHDLLDKAVRVVRDERQDPLVRDAGALFARMTCGAYSGVAADVDEQGDPVVKGVRADGSGAQGAATMSEGTRDQLFLAFRLASVAAYCAAAEPLPFVGDDLLVHFDDARAEATLELLADCAATTQVLLFTHHASVRDAALRLAAKQQASVTELAISDAG